MVGWIDFCIVDNFLLLHFPESLVVCLFLLFSDAVLGYDCSTVRVKHHVIGAGATRKVLSLLCSGSGSWERLAAGWPQRVFLHLLSPLFVSFGWTLSLQSISFS